MSAHYLEECLKTTRPTERELPPSSRRRTAPLTRKAVVPEQLKQQFQDLTTETSAHVAREFAQACTHLPDDALDHLLCLVPVDVFATLCMDLVEALKEAEVIHPLSHCGVLLTIARQRDWLSTEEVIVLLHACGQYMAELKLTDFNLCSLLIDAVPGEISAESRATTCARIGKAMQDAGIDVPVQWKSLVEKAMPPERAMPQERAMPRAERLSLQEIEQMTLELLRAQVTDPLAWQAMQAFLRDSWFGGDDTQQALLTAMLSWQMESGEALGMLDSLDMKICLDCLQSDIEGEGQVHFWTLFAQGSLSPDLQRDWLLRLAAHADSVEAATMLLRELNQLAKRDPGLLDSSVVCNCIVRLGMLRESKAAPVKEFEELASTKLLYGLTDTAAMIWWGKQMIHALGMPDQSNKRIVLRALHELIDSHPESLASTDFLASICHLVCSDVLDAECLQLARQLAGKACMALMHDPRPLIKLFGGLKWPFVIHILRNTEGWQPLLEGRDLRDWWKLVDPEVVHNFMVGMLEGPQVEWRDDAMSYHREVMEKEASLGFDLEMMYVLLGSVEHTPTREVLLRKEVDDYIREHIKGKSLLDRCEIFGSPPFGIARHPGATRFLDLGRRIYGENWLTSLEPPTGDEDDLP